MNDTKGPPLIQWGRCRAAHRWFWYAQEIGGDSREGWTSDRAEAVRRGNAAAVKLAAGRYATISINNEPAKARAEAAFAARQAKAKAEHEQRAQSGGQEYLYAVEPGYYDFDECCWVYSRVLRLEVTKKTARRIYYVRSDEPSEYGPGHIDRQKFEAFGSVDTSRYGQVYAERPELPPDKPWYPRVRVTVPRFRPPRPPADLKQLKAAMAAAHPDRGGTDEAFIAARKRYVAAKQMAGLR